MKNVRRQKALILSCVLLCCIIVGVILVLLATSQKTAPIHYTGENSSVGTVKEGDETIYLIYSMLALGGYGGVTYDEVFQQLSFAGLDVNNMQDVSPAQIAKAIVTDGPTAVADISGADEVRLADLVSYGALPLISVENGNIRSILLIDTSNTYWVARSAVKTGLITKSDIYDDYVAGGAKAIALLPKIGKTGKACDLAELETVLASVGNSKIGVVLPTSLESRWPVAYKQFKKADPAIRILYSDHDPNLEKKNIKTLVDNGCKVLVICPVYTESAEEVEYAKSKGATVICYERMITGTASIDYFIAFDNFDVGVMQGQYLVDMAEGKGKGLNLYLYFGGEFDDSALVFLPGVWQAIQPKLADGTFIVQNSPAANALKNKKILTDQELLSIADPAYTEWDAGKAKNLVRKDLDILPKSVKGMVFVRAPNDDTSRAITDAFRADPDVNMIYSTGQDFTKESIQYIIDGKQGMTVEKPDQYLVDNALEIAGLILAGQKPSSDIFNCQYDNGTANIPSILVKGNVVTQMNVKDAIRQSGLYFLSEFTNLK